MTRKKVNNDQSKSHVSKVNNEAMKQAMRYYRKLNYIVDDVSGNKKRGKKGYDLEISKDGEKKSVEVKGTTKNGIPDAYESEFDGIDKEPKEPKELKFKAHELCLVKMNSSFKSEEIVILSREQIDEYQNFHKVVKRVRFSSRLRTNVNKGKIGGHIKL